MPPAAKTQSRSQTPTGERLQKVLAAAGKGSRRECEEIILAGRVEVDRKVITELGTRVDTAEQAIRVDGERLTFSFTNRNAAAKLTDESGFLYVIMPVLID